MYSTPRESSPSPLPLMYMQKLFQNSTPRVEPRMQDKIFRLKNVQKDPSRPGLYAHDATHFPVFSKVCFYIFFFETSDKISTNPSRSSTSFTYRICYLSCRPPQKLARWPMHLTMTKTMAMPLTMTIWVIQRHLPL